MSQRRVEGLPAAAAVLELRRVDEGRWAWVYRELETGFLLHSNLSYSTEDEARESGRLAYPDLSFADGDE